MKSILKSIMLTIIGFTISQFVYNYASSNLTYKLLQLLEYLCIGVFIILLILVVLDKYINEQDK